MAVKHGPRINRLIPDNINPSDKVFSFTKEGWKASLVIYTLISNNSSNGPYHGVIREVLLFDKKGETGAQKWSTPSKAIQVAKQ